LNQKNKDKNKKFVFRLERSYFSTDRSNNLETNYVNTYEDDDNDPLFISNQSITNHAGFYIVNILFRVFNSSII
jgi:hypothetical protein